MYFVAWGLVGCFSAAKFLVAGSVSRCPQLSRSRRFDRPDGRWLSAPRTPETPRFSSGCSLGAVLAPTLRSAMWWAPNNRQTFPLDFPRANFGPGLAVAVRWPVVFAGGTLLVMAVTSAFAYCCLSSYLGEGLPPFAGVVAGRGDWQLSDRGLRAGRAQPEARHGGRPSLQHRQGATRVVAGSAGGAHDWCPFSWSIGRPGGRSQRYFGLS